MPLRRYVTINGLKCLLGPAPLPPSVRRLRELGLRRPIRTNGAGKLGPRTRCRIV